MTEKSENFNKEEKKDSNPIDKFNDDPIQDIL